MSIADSVLILQRKIIINRLTRIYVRRREEDEQLNEMLFNDQE